MYNCNSLFCLLRVSFSEDFSFFINFCPIVLPDQDCSFCGVYLKIAKQAEDKRPKREGGGGWRELCVSWAFPILYFYTLQIQS